jgi:probable rRNA maturation factor
MIFVNVTDAIAPKVDLTLLEQAALETVHLAGEGQVKGAESEATILLTGDEQLHELNLKYLDVDAPTDVLSFPAGYVDPDSNINYLGDILISYPRAQTQAATGGHTVEDELRLLVVHGMLHLLGYDHGDPAEKAQMWAIQARILESLGCPLPPP